MFDKIHVSGASASCPGDISSDESSDDDVSEAQKTQDIDDVKLAALKKSKPGKKRKEHSSSIEEKDKKSPFFQPYKSPSLYSCGQYGNGGCKILKKIKCSFLKW